MTEPIIANFVKGAIPNKTDLRNYRLEALPCATVLPSVFSVKEKVGKIKSQNGSGSCVSQAVTYYAEILNTIETGEKVSLSPKFLYPWVFQKPMGSSIADNMARVCNEGIALESDVTSYENGNPPSEAYMQIKPTLSQQMLDLAKTYIAKKYVTWDNSSVEWFKRAMVQGNGCVVASWGNNLNWRTGDIELPAFREQMVWRHGICLIGYDDSKKAFEFVNSWGTEWGNGGFGWLPYAYVEQGYVSSPMSLVDVPNGTYSLLMKLIGLYHNVISLLKK